MVCDCRDDVQRGGLPDLVLRGRRHPQLLADIGNVQTCASLQVTCSGVARLGHAEGNAPVVERKIELGTSTHVYELTPERK